MLGHNQYNTDDPAILLKLKQQEAEQILGLVRDITPQSSRKEVINKVIATIRKQLDVHKIMMVGQQPQGKVLHVNHEFNLPEPARFDDLDAFLEVTKVDGSAGDLPALIGAEYILPLGLDKDKPAAWILIAEFADSEAEELNDLIFIETVGSLMVLMVDQIDLFEERQQQLLLQNELDVASRIQQESLPSDFDLLEQLDIDARCIAHYKVAGDFYDLVIIDEDEIFICVADAAGKGIAAAMLVANIQANLRALIETDASYYVILHRLHQAIAKLTHNERFVTIFFAKVDIVKQQIEYINAGHNPPLLLRKDGSVEELSKGSIPLGILPIETYEVGFADFKPGDVLFAYSDGVVEQENAAGDLLGLEAVRAVLHQNMNETSANISDKVLDRVHQHSNGVPNTDDISMMTVKYKN